MDSLALRGYRWSPGGEPRAAIAIAHGAAEHSLRYARFAAALNDVGIEVWSIDQRGHGQSPGPDGLGDYGEGGWDALVADIGQLIEHVRDARPDAPVGLFAHSMGSFAAQQYVLDHSEAIDFLVLSGSTAFEAPLPGAPPAAFTPNASFEPARTPYDWLSRDESEVDAYIADPLCGFETQTGRRESSAFDRSRLGDERAFEAVRAGLPILLLAGEEDPINRGMEGLHLLERRYQAARVARLDTQYYADGRHEMLNETNRDEATANLVGWIDSVLEASVDRETAATPPQPRRTPMPQVAPLPPEEIENYEAFAAAAIERMGFVVNSTKTMARRPEIRDAFGRLFVAVFGSGEVDAGLKHMVAQVASVAAGCRYCEAHTAGSAHRSGVPAEKIEALYEFESSPLFDEAERAALRLGRDAAIQPNATTPAHFAALREHFSEAQIVELTAVVATFGFLNRWNDTMATELEDEPLAFGAEHLAAHGWERGKHE